MIADLLTKALPAPRILALRDLFKIKAIQGDAEKELLEYITS